MALLELKNIVKKFADYTAVNGVNLNIQQGEFFTLLGPSGCGKTTLLRMIAGFENPDSGEILLDGQNIVALPPEKRPLHTVFQSYALFPHLTVAENIAFPLKMAKISTPEIKERVDEQINQVQLTKFASRYPHELSGGQRQRVAIARSLVNRPKLLLLDEPLSALDARLREHMHVELVKIQESSGITFVYVTHDQSEALALSSKIAVMNNGIVAQLGSPQEIYSKPNSFYVADFIGKCNLLRATVTRIFVDKIEVTMECGLVISLLRNDYPDINQVGQAGWFAIRPEKIKVHRTHKQDANLLTYQTTIKGYYYYGDGTLYEFYLPDGSTLQCLLANNQVENKSFFNDGDTVFVSINPESGTFLVN